MPSSLTCCLVVAAIAGSGVQGASATSRAPRDSLTDRIDSILAPYDNRSTPGCAVALVREGRVVLERGYGMASLEHHVPITPATVFDIGSVSKQFTALSVLMLAREGKLELSDDVRKYLPELPVTGTPVTLRHLLQQTSGLRDYVDLFPFAGVQYAAVVTPRDALVLLARQRGVNFAAGDEWGYSNTNYFLLSEVVERVSGQQLGAFLKQRIFDPLGMRSTGLWERHGQVVADRAQSYASAENGAIETVAYNWETTGDGAIQSTVGDMVLWMQNLDSARVGGRSLIAQLQTRAVLNSGDSVNYGMGLLVGTWRGLRRVGHNGAAAGFRADVVRFPDQHFAVATLCNNGDVNPTLVNLGIAGVALAQNLPPRPAGASVGGSPGGPKAEVGIDAARYTGTYFSPASGLTRTLSVRDGRLMLDGGGPPAELSPLGDGLFQAGGTPLRIRLESGSRGEPRRLVELPPAGYLATSYGRVADTVRLSDGALREYSGVYASRELGASWTVLVRGGDLVLRLPGQAVADDTLHQDFADGFSSQAAPLKFVRDRQHHVTGLRIWSRAVRGLRLAKQPR